MSGEAPEALRRVLTQVNSSARYRHEPAGRDHWQTPDELRASGAGDCEDFAIAYWQALRDQDPPPRLACLILDGRREMHMVCLCGEWVLDVLADEPYRLSDRDDLLQMVYALGERDGVPVVWVGDRVLPALPMWADVWQRLKIQGSRFKTKDCGP